MKKRKEKPKTHPLTPRVGHPAPGHPPFLDNSSLCPYTIVVSANGPREVEKKQSIA